LVTGSNPVRPTIYIIKFTNNFSIYKHLEA
jgi:hypothetical protein